MKTQWLHFALGFGGALLICIILNALVAHVRSDCGILAVLRMAACADDIIRVGFPFLVLEEGGFAYRNLFYPEALVADIAIALLLSVAVGYASQRLWRR